MSSDPPRPLLMGIPIELRLQVYDILLERDREEVIVCCCEYHAGQMHANNPSAWAGRRADQLEPCAQALSTLIRTSNAIASEIKAYCFKNWRIETCIEHQPLGHSRSTFPHMHSGFGPWILPPQSLSLWQPCHHLSSFLRVVPTVQLRVDFSSFTDGYGQKRALRDWSDNIRSWAILDTTRQCVRFLNSIKIPVRLALKINMNGGVIGQALQDYLTVFEQLSSTVQLQIGIQEDEEYDDDGYILPPTFSSTSPGDLDEQYLQQLQMSNRSTHFRPHVVCLQEAWYKLNAWANHAFGYVSERKTLNVFGIGTFYAANINDQSSIPLLLDEAWSAHHTADPARFERAKAGLRRIFQARQDECWAQFHSI